MRITKEQVQDFVIKATVLINIIAKLHEKILSTNKDLIEQVDEIHGDLEKKVHEIHGEIEKKVDEINVYIAEENNKINEDSLYAFTKRPGVAIIRSLPRTLLKGHLSIFTELNKYELIESLEQKVSSIADKEYNKQEFDVIQEFITSFDNEAKTISQQTEKLLQKLEEISKPTEDLVKFLKRLKRVSQNGNETIRKLAVEALQNAYTEWYRCCCDVKGLKGSIFGEPKNITEATVNLLHKCSQLTDQIKESEKEIQEALEDDEEKEQNMLLTGSIIIEELFEGFFGKAIAKLSQEKKPDDKGSGPDPEAKDLLNAVTTLFFISESILPRIKKLDLERGDEIRVSAPVIEESTAEPLQPSSEEKKPDDKGSGARL
ncbi:hypothetical protein RLOatenuis_2040 [Rickettsiales bacterium]|nr:hypothetical protein RLOatenuis_2040 [Rickettsiales bacterium]